MMLTLTSRVIAVGLALAAVFVAPAAATAAPACSTLPAPFPCGQGTHPICIKREKCVGGTGIVPQTKSVCTMTKCVNNPPKPGPQNTQAKSKKLNPQPEPPGKTQ